jgi:hypothetical protein
VTVPCGPTDRREIEEMMQALGFDQLSSFLGFAAKQLKRPVK